MKFTAGFLAKVVLSWGNNRYCIAAVQRDLMISWSCHFIESTLQSTRNGGAEGCSDMLDALMRFVPHESVLSELIRSVAQHYWEPADVAKNVVMAILDG